MSLYPPDYSTTSEGVSADNTSAGGIVAAVGDSGSATGSRDDSSGWVNDSETTSTESVYSVFGDSEGDSLGACVYKVKVTM